MNDNDNNVRMLELLSHEASMLAMDEDDSSVDDRRWAEQLAATMHARIAEYRRSRLPTNVPITKASPISERLLALPRAALESLFASLVENLGSDAQFAHRKLDALSDNDLRRLIQTIETRTAKD